MARSRLLHPEFALHEGLAELSHAHRLLFAMLPMIADREGLLEDRPRRIKADLFPYDTDEAADVDNGLVQLERIGCIQRTTINAKPVIAIPGFLRWQKPHLREKASELVDDAAPAKKLGRPRARLGTNKAISRRPVSVSVSVSDPVSVQEPLSSSQATSPVQEVFKHWQIVMRKPRAVLDSKRRARIEERLAEGRSVGDLCLAIDGYSRDPFSMGKNDRSTKYNDISLICRDAEHVEKFMPAAPLGTGPPAKPQRTHEERLALVEAKFGTEAKRGNG